MKLDIYTKLVLTVIALGLWGLLLQPLILPKEVGASSAIIDVNIKEINGKRVKSILDVNVEQVKGQNIYNYAIPVELKN
jgi:hypothetical protein